MMRLGSSNALKASQSTQMLQRRIAMTRRGLSTPSNGGNKPTLPPTQQKKPRDPPSFLGFVLSSTVLGVMATTLVVAKQLDDDDPKADLFLAKRLASYPLIGFFVNSHLDVLNAMRKAGILDPKPDRVQPQKKNSELSAAPASAPVAQPAVVEPEPTMVEAAEVEEIMESLAEEKVAEAEQSTETLLEKEQQQQQQQQEEEVVAHAEEALHELHDEQEAQAAQVSSEVVHLDEHHHHVLAAADAVTAAVHEQQRHEETVAAAEVDHSVAEVAQAEGHLPRVSSEQSLAVGKNHSVGDVLSTVAKNSLALRHELENALLKDIHSLEAPALRIRITQLAAEMFERLSWESIRLSHSVRQVENELTDKYESLMAKQRKELELEVEKLLLAKECQLNAQADAKAAAIAKTFQDELHATIKAQAEGFQATLQHELDSQSKKIRGELQEQLLHEVAMLRKSHADLLMSLQPKIDGLQQQVQSFDKVFDETSQAVDFTLRSHAISSAVLGLELLLSEQSTAGYAQKNIEEKFIKLENLCKDDALVTNLLKALPVRVRKEGALSVSELQVRFQVMRDEVRKAALAPEEAPKIVGQLIGSVLAAISIAPKGFVSGAGTEEILARAAYYVELGKIQPALLELAKVSGYEKVLMNDWLSLAQERLIVDQALRTLKADSVVRHKSFEVK